MQEAVRELSKKHTIVYWTAPDIGTGIDPALFPQTTFHNHHDALLGKPAFGISLEGFPPPSEEFIVSFSETESAVLTMMNKRFEKMGLTERKRLYHTYLRYWSGVLKRFQPDAIIFPNVPHTCYDFVVYALAQRLKIKTIMIDPTWITDRVTIFTDYKERGGKLAAEVSALSSVSVSLDDLPDDIRRAYEWQTNNTEDATPVFLHAVKKKYAQGWLRRSFSVLKNLLRDNLKREYKRVASPPDFGAPFVYVPLHYQPERTTCPQGGSFVDQVLMIETLAAALPAGWRIFVKEHPTQWLYRGLRFFSYRYKGYYEKIAAIPHTTLVPFDTNHYMLLTNATAVATLTGTAGFEAICRLIPVLVFGYPWYQDFPGLCKVHDVSMCADAFARIKAGQTFTKQTVLAYLKALQNGTFHAYLDWNGKKVSKLSTEENTAAIVAALESVLS